MESFTLYIYSIQSFPFAYKEDVNLSKPYLCWISSLNLNKDYMDNWLTEHRMFVFENTTHWIVRLPRPLKGIFNKLFTTLVIQEFTTRNLHCFALCNYVCLIVKVEEAIKEQLIFYTGISIMFQTFYYFYGFTSVSIPVCGI